jgi:hypothetical protein
VAPRPVLRGCQRCARGAGLLLGLWLAGAGGALACTPPHQTTAMPETVSAVSAAGVRAWYDGPTTRYPHGVLGDTVEGTELHVMTSASPCSIMSVTLPETLVFEDTMPRLADLDGDGQPEIIVVQSHRDLGAQLAVYAPAADGASLDLIAATPFIGRRNRWLAPIGAGDLDGDGRVEIAYIDRPHLARTLRVWRYEGGQLTEIASADGLTNHRIGDPTIPGGLRDCGDGPEMITADAGWSRVIATRLGPDGRLTSRDLGPWWPGALNAALSC